MEIGIHNYHKIYNLNNGVFNSEIYPFGENLEYPFVLLKKLFEDNRIEICTLDNYPISQFSKIIFLDYPRNIDLNDLREKGIKLYLIILESEIIRKENFVIQNHLLFENIFTWSDILIYEDKTKYIKLNYCHKFPREIKKELFSKKKTCTLIAGNKTNTDPRELYSERVKAIRWFEKNHSTEFDLYGISWEKGEIKYSSNFIRKIKKVIKLFYRRVNSPFPSNKGKIESKKEILKGYKFAICYENAKDIPGYITEKIFDCFFAGCVPIYLGAPNISDFIPKECYIDKNLFETYEELYQYISMMSESEYALYINAIERYLKSENSNSFRGEYFAEIIFNKIFECDEEK